MWRLIRDILLTLFLRLFWLLGVLVVFLFHLRRPKLDIIDWLLDWNRLPVTHTSTFEKFWKILFFLFNFTTAVKLVISAALFASNVNVKFFPRQRPKGGTDLCFPSVRFWASARHQLTLWGDHGYGTTASHGVLVYAPAFADTHCVYPRRDGQAELTWNLLVDAKPWLCSW